MSELSTLARPYAQAVFKTAQTSNSSSEWSDMLSFLSVVMQDKEIIALIGNPKVLLRINSMRPVKTCSNY